MLFAKQQIKDQNGKLKRLFWLRNFDTKAAPVQRKREGGEREREREGEREERERERERER